VARAFHSSGDLIADRRASYADMLFDSGDFAAAADLMMQALELVPEWTAGRFRLGEMWEASGRHEDAASAWRTVLEKDPDDHFGAGLKLAATGHAAVPATPPPAYVETLFDAYAPTFETALLDRLEYRIPELLAHAIEVHGGARRYHSVLDLGCGTGLMGPYVRPLADRLDGMDLSELMLQKAAEKQIYDNLIKGDVNDFEVVHQSIDLVIAADVFIYVGDLDRAFGLVAQSLAADGLFAFSVENQEDSDSPVLQPSLRYTHSQAYITRLLASHAMILVSLICEAIRLDRGEPLLGLIVVARREERF
jgi:predicted TPR repeat methyltransferase